MPASIVLQSYARGVHDTLHKIAGDASVPASVKAILPELYDYALQKIASDELAIVEGLFTVPEFTKSAQGLGGMLRGLGDNMSLDNLRQLILDHPQVSDTILGGAAGTALGGIAGAASADEGEGWEGAGKGALAGLGFGGLVGYGANRMGYSPSHELFGDSGNHPTVPTPDQSLLGTGEGFDSPGNHPRQVDPLMNGELAAGAKATSDEFALGEGVHPGWVAAPNVNSNINTDVSPETDMVEWFRKNYKNKEVQALLAKLQADPTDYHPGEINPDNLSALGFRPRPDVQGPSFDINDPKAGLP